MTYDPVDPVHGVKMSEWIRTMPYGLDHDDIPVGLYDACGTGEGLFKLSGSALVDYCRRCLHALYQAGGRPIAPAGDGSYDWVYTDRYGTSEDEIVENMLAEWIASGRDPEWGEWGLGTDKQVRPERPPG